ncbi:PREDICTED: probable leucine-rich repeat receptor-like serine/threonine-protein kinase At3g14840 [Ipomoea nil]|uniref:probable leucine-rich repeat receptor-like serine/threonine-protein kinase At3g14840 n=1 Tax=Ipomoea nil TaxID=35883 RepID=UPI000900E129|nr:PREDICTED: probable leucine-rich repeat receptor-like serine/threonine-protein kinase At3g14840 [Ipomoea nil]
MMSVSNFFVFFLWFSAIFAASASTAPGGPLLATDEVAALRQIGKTLGKTDWDFNVDPCSGDPSWVSPNPTKEKMIAVTCDCSDNTTCHVISIALKQQDLGGTLPAELVKLPFLQDIDLSRNYLGGTIPPEWGSMKLVNISLLGNRITGQIPKELGNISTLVNMTLECNQLSGTVPPELGNLTLINKLHLLSNNLSGELPKELAKLTALKDFRIGDNYFNGSIPDFIGKWTDMEKLVIQGSGLSGPIPTGISSLTKLTDLRITDLNGMDSKFPNLRNATKLKTLILRSCNIVDQLPDYFGSLTKLNDLDLSFNKLSGQVPRTIGSSKDIKFIYLTGNLLTGDVPEWITKTLDLSYNNYTNTPKSLGSSSCQQNLINMFASSYNGNRSGIVSCLKECPRKWYAIHINCGGQEVKSDNGTTYEADPSTATSGFVSSQSNWALSSTGHLFDNSNYSSKYQWSTNSRISSTSSQLYTDARNSPLSLTYYGFCLENGNYTVNLHFAEIVFTDIRSYSSLGRRIFDIYIQGKLVAKDFNIESEAGGVNKAVIKPFTAVVNETTLEIRLYWAGKGTTVIPVKGVYGPLISAISVVSDFQPPSSSEGLSAGAIVGIVLAVLSTILIALGILWWKGCLQNKNAMEQDLKGIAVAFTLRQIKAATKNFDASNKIGEGGFGPVYKGRLSDGTDIAVKQLSSKSKQGNREFINEIGMISALQHPNLVKLYGCCIEGNQLLLVYEYMENNSLARALFGPVEQQLKLDWTTRYRICISIAKGLAYLHEESRLKIVHRDIKATNILLDKDLNPKISDFGLAKLDEEENTHISTRIAGTFGYMAPEYAMHGYLTDKADVYSYGVVVLEIVSGRSTGSIKPKDQCFNLLDWANALKEQGNIMGLVDPRLGTDFNKEEALVAINIAFLCTNVVSASRPTMSAVVSMLDSRSSLEEFEFSTDVTPGNIMKSKEEDKLIDVPDRSETMDVPWTASSTSTSDLYPIVADSSYWEKRE